MRGSDGRGGRGEETNLVRKSRRRNARASCAQSFLLRCRCCCCCGYFCSSRSLSHHLVLCAVSLATTISPIRTTTNTPPVWCSDPFGRRRSARVNSSLVLVSVSVPVSVPVSVTRLARHPRTPLSDRRRHRHRHQSTPTARRSSSDSVRHYSRPRSNIRHHSHTTSNIVVDSKPPLSRRHADKRKLRKPPPWTRHRHRGRNAWQQQQQRRRRHQRREEIRPIEARRARMARRARPRSGAKARMHRHSHN